MIEVIKVVLLGKKGGETASNHCWTEGFLGGGSAWRSKPLHKNWISDCNIKEYIRGLQKPNIYT